jgi:hypothetical protein
VIALGVPDVISPLLGILDGIVDVEVGLRGAAREEVIERVGVVELSLSEARDLEERVILQNRVEEIGAKKMKEVFEIGWAELVLYVSQKIVCDSEPK